LNIEPGTTILNELGRASLSSAVYDKILIKLLRLSFKKSVNRAGTTVSTLNPLRYHLVTTAIDFQLLQKTGQIERTVDREFAEEEAKFKMYATPLHGSFMQMTGVS
jgi:hypothetical protein